MYLNWIRTCFLILFLVSTSVFAQNKKLDKADTFFKEQAYPKAAELYEASLLNDDIAEAKLRLADCYRLMKNDVISEYWHNLVIEIPGVDPSYIYNYAVALKANGKFDEAKKQFTKYASLRPDDTRALNQLESCENINSYLSDPGKYFVSNASINSSLADFGPAFYRSGIVFASESKAKGKGLYPRRNAPYLDLFYAERIGDDPSELEGTRALKGKTNTAFHEGAASFSPDYSVMYYTANQSYNTSKKKKGKGPQVLNLKIYRMALTEGSWSEPFPFEYNSDSYSVGHPSITADGNLLYFTSNMPGGFGGTDIYVCEWTGESWSAPKNLGKQVNTAGDEMFPFIAQDNTLYFSSDVLSGLGGLDVFSTQKVGKGNWSTPKNLQYPINSNGDDFSFIIDRSNSFGYFASNRSGGKGNDDIYSFNTSNIQAPPKAISCQLVGRVINKSTGVPVEGAIAKLINSKTGKETVMNTASDGSFTFALESESDYALYTSKKYYFTDAQVFSTRGRDCSSALSAEVKLNIQLSALPDSPIKIVSGQENLYPHLPLPDLKHIYYDLDESYIRPEAKVELNKIVQFMMDNPDLHVELSSHTDSRGSDSYNKALSERRAKSAADYIISKGISSEKLSYVGMGESQIVNGCTNGVTCTDEQHQENRRTEFVILGYSR